MKSSKNVFVQGGFSNEAVIHSGDTVELCHLGNSSADSCGGSAASTSFDTESNFAADSNYDPNSGSVTNGDTKRYSAGDRNSAASGPDNGAIGFHDRSSNADYNEGGGG